MRANHQKATITRIAEEAGLSVATVSRALNKSGYVSHETRKKVLELAGQMNYVVNPRFRAMGKTSSNSPHRTGTIGLILPEARLSVFITDPYYARLFWSIESSAKTCGYHLTTTTIGTDEESEFLPSFVSDMNVDGVLVSGVTSRNVNMIRRISSLMPVVLVNDVCHELPLPSVMPDEHAAIAKSLQYLRGLGHRNILFFDIHDGHGRHHPMRAQAFGQLSVGHEGESSLVMAGRTKSMEETAFDLLKTWLALGQLPTAILCAADFYALAFIEVAESLGVDVPGQLSVLGIDNTVFGERSRPKLTSISQPLEQMGRAAVELLKMQIDRVGCSSDEVASTHFFNVTLMERASCAPPRSHDKGLPCVGDAEAALLLESRIVSGISASV